MSRSGLSLEILTTNDANRWNATLKEIGKYDFFHLAAFHKLAEMRGEGSPVMPVYRERDYILAFPLLLRDIEIAGIPTDLKDATSIAGLAGPVASARTPIDVIERFHQELQNFFEQSSIIAIYSRLNPLLNQPALLAGYGEVVEIGVTQSIDLTPPPDVQFSRYKRFHRRNIKRLQSLGFTCEKVGIEYLDDFIRIYTDTMKRCNADQAYYFDKSYFEFLFSEMSDVIHFFICKDQETVVSVGICSACNGIIQGYLAGTATEYLPLAPSKLVYDAIRRWGNEIGANTFHLGGSVGGRKDSLYDFKMGFGAQEHVYSTWRHIADQKSYNSLCLDVWQQAGEKQDTSYFPSYRHPKLKVNHIQKPYGGVIHAGSK